MRTLSMLIIAAAVLFAGYFTSQEPSKPRQAVVESTVSWPTGRSTWAVSWQVKTQASVGSSLQAEADVQAEIELTAHTGTTWAARFTRFETLEFTVQGQAQNPPTEALIGPALYVRLDATGAPVEWWADPQAPSGFAHLMTGYLRRLQVLKPGVERERTPLGMASVTVRREGSIIRRTRQAYLTLDGIETTDVPASGEQVITLDLEDIMTITDTDTVATEGYRADVAFYAEQLSSEPVEATPPPALRVVHRPGQPSQAGRRRLWEKQAGHLTAARLLSDLRRFSTTDAHPDSEWLWRAAGRLLLDPDLAAELADLVPSLQPGAQALVFDLLAGVGHAQAQAAMISALPKLDPITRRGLMQRLGQIQQPDEATVAYAQTLLEVDDPEDRRVGAMTLGAVASRLGDSADAERIGDQLVNALRDADTTEDRQALVAAVGNAGLPALEEAIVEHTNDASPKVRRAATYALRKYDTPTARDVLLTAIAGDDAIVQQTALSALNPKSMAPSEVARLADATTTKQLAKGSRTQVLNAASKGLRDADEAQIEAWRGVLEGIVATGGDDPRLAGQARKMLRGLNQNEM